MNVIDEESGLLSNSVKDIVCDTEGNYYIGTTEGISLVSLSGGVKIIKNYQNIDLGAFLCYFNVNSAFHRSAFIALHREDFFLP